MRRLCFARRAPYLVAVSKPRRLSVARTALGFVSSVPQLQEVRPYCGQWPVCSSTVFASRLISAQTAPGPSKVSEQMWRVNAHAACSHRYLVLWLISGPVRVCIIEHVFAHSGEPGHEYVECIAGFGRGSAWPYPRPCPAFAITTKSSQGYGAPLAEGMLIGSGIGCFNRRMRLLIPRKFKQAGKSGASGSPLLFPRWPHG